MRHVIKNSANFKVKNVAAPTGLKIKRDETYKAVAIGFNGHFLIVTESGRKVWYNDKYFKILDSDLKFKGCVIGRSISDLGFKNKK